MTAWPTIEDVRGAVARGWCSPENSHKEMDSVLAEAIATEVTTLLAPAQSVLDQCIRIANEERESHLAVVRRTSGEERMINLGRSDGALGVLHAIERLLPAKLEP